jgi:hypothetical protein
MTTRKRQAPERSSKVVRALTAFARAKKGDGEAEGSEDDGTDDAAKAEPSTPPRPAPAPVEEAAAPPPPRPAPAPVEEAAAPPPPRPAPAPVEEAPAPPPPRPAPPVAAAPAPAGAAPDGDPEHTVLPDPRSVVPGDPDASEPPPRLVPRGDSRSLRRGHGPTEEFALVYRNKSFLVTRVGVVGRRGTWRVVEYPSQGSAAHAYAQECSRLVGEGFADYQA